MDQLKVKLHLSGFSWIFFFFPTSFYLGLPLYLSSTWTHLLNGKLWFNRHSTENGQELEWKRETPSFQGKPSNYCSRQVDQDRKSEDWVIGSIMQRKGWLEAFKQYCYRYNVTAEAFCCCMIVNFWMFPLFNILWSEMKQPFSWKSGACWSMVHDLNADAICI